MAKLRHYHKNCILSSKKNYIMKKKREQNKNKYKSYYYLNIALIMTKLYEWNLKQNKTGTNKS